MYERKIRKCGWKVLASAIEVIKGYECGPWKEEGDARLDRFEANLS